MTWPHGPLVLAPMAGGPGSPELVAAVSEAGLFGFLPAGYLSATDLESRITAIRALTAAPFGVNVFVPSPDSPLAHTEAMGYAARLAPWAADAGVELGRPSWDDDGYETKVDLLVGNPVPVVSFTFGWPSGHDVERLQDVGSQVWVTINDPAETEWAQELGVDGVVAQGWEAGGHRGGPVDNGEEHLPTAALLAAVRRWRHDRSGGAHAARGRRKCGRLRHRLPRVPRGRARPRAPARPDPSRGHHGHARLHRAQRPRPADHVDRRDRRGRARGIPPCAPPHGASPPLGCDAFDCGASERFFAVAAV